MLAKITKRKDEGQGRGDYDAKGTISVGEIGIVGIHSTGPSVESNRIVSFIT
jgi:hypothetical protein